MNKALLSGVSAVVIWSYLAVTIAMLGNIPPFEILCFSMVTGSMLTSIQLTIQKRWHLMRAPIEMWVVGSLFLAGMNITYICAFKFAPPVHAKMIYYMWPLFVVIGGAIFFKEKLTSRRIFGIALCVLSMFTLHFDHFQVPGGVSLEHMYGYGFAVAGSILSAVYNLVSKKHATLPSQIVGLYAGIGAILSLTGHILFEKTVVPSKFELVLLVLMGISAHWIAYQAWDRAVKNLESWKICVIAYLTPSLSVAFLIIAGFGVLSWPVCLSCSLLFVGSIIASFKPKKDRRHSEVGAIAG